LKLGWILPSQTHHVTEDDFKNLMN